VAVCLSSQLENGNPGAVSEAICPDRPKAVGRLCSAENDISDPFSIHDHSQPLLQPLMVAIPTQRVTRSAQEMIFRNLIFEPKVMKQRLRAGMVRHHEQLASECNGEQQHRELWSAYNLNVAPPQASTEGLFQQPQAISLRTPRGTGRECKGDFSPVDSTQLSRQTLLAFRTICGPVVNTNHGAPLSVPGDLSTMFPLHAEAKTISRLQKLPAAV